mmetsp:Transcript_9576/g.30665  ORF Transcript_9576/g.30665 Transcript_9576/m.30665 type:complete len:267 (-) Transcript_9576:215-1015(-)
MVSFQSNNLGRAASLRPRRTDCSRRDRAHAADSVEHRFHFVKFPKLGKTRLARRRDVVDLELAVTSDLPSESETWMNLNASLFKAFQHCLTEQAAAKWGSQHRLLLQESFRDVARNRKISPNVQYNTAASCTRVEIEWSGFGDEYRASVKFLEQQFCHDLTICSFCFMAFADEVSLPCTATRTALEERGLRISKESLEPLPVHHATADHHIFNLGVFIVARKLGSAYPEATLLRRRRHSRGHTVRAYCGSRDDYAGRIVAGKTALE